MQFKILNLNCMAGKNATSSVFPLKFEKGLIEQNLAKIADFISIHDPQIVTLQEIDHVAWRTSFVDELSFLADHTKCAHRFLGIHRKRAVYRMGTAILSKMPLHDTYAEGFPLTFPTSANGYTSAIIEIGNLPVRVVSVHMNWLNWIYPGTKKIQLHRLRNHISDWKGPLIIAGDFNANPAGSTALRHFLQGFNLKTYNIESQIYTWPTQSPSVRIDWIFVSEHFSIQKYETVSVPLSDHLPIIATIEITNA